MTKTSISKAVSDVKLKVASTDGVASTNEDASINGASFKTDPFAHDSAPIPLGYDSNYNQVYLWSKEADAIIIRSTQELDKLHALESIIDRKWLRLYGSNPEGKLLGPKIGTIIRENAKHRGIFSTEQEYGLGVYYDKKLDKVIVNSRHECIDLDHNAIERISDGRKIIYTKTGPKDPPKLMKLGNAPDAETYTEDEARAVFLKILQTLHEWNIAGGTGGKGLIMGWLMSTCVVGALPQRPSIWLEGAKGSGKSTLQDFMYSISEDWVLRKSAGSTATAIKQDLGVSAASVILDEAAKDTDPNVVNRINGIIALMRTAYSSLGTLDSIGSPDGKTKKYRTASSVCYASVHKPKLQDQDASRIAFISILQRQDQNSETESKRDAALISMENNKLFKETLKVTERDKAIFFSYSCYAYKNYYNKALETLEVAWRTESPSTSGIDREIDTYGTMLSLALAVGATEDNWDKQAVTFIRDLSETLDDSRKNSKEYTKLLETILEHKVPIMQYNDARELQEKREDMSIGSVIVAIMKKTTRTGSIEKDVYWRALQAVGLTITKKETKNIALDVPLSSSILVQILSRVDLKWKADGSWKAALEEIEGAERSRAYIDSIKKHCISIPVEVLELVDEDDNPVQSPIII
jgi:hypothetical protein